MHVSYANAFGAAQPIPLYTNTISVVAAFLSQPRVESAVTDEMFMIEICQLRVFGDLISICDGSHVC